MIATTDPQGATPGWYPWPDGGVGYWDGERWTGERRSREPDVPWTSLLAWALVVLGALGAGWLSERPGDVGAGVYAVVAGVPGAAGVLLAAYDVRRGRRGRLPTGAAKALLWLVLGAGACVAMSVLLFAVGAAQGGG